MGKMYVYTYAKVTYRETRMLAHTRIHTHINMLRQKYIFQDYLPYNGKILVAMVSSSG